VEEDMNLREYYNNIREIARTIESEFAVVVSNKTDDGGRAGILTEVTRDAAARLIADDKATLASPAQAQEYYAELRAKHVRQIAEEQQKRMALDVFSRGGLEALRKSLQTDE
jgi:hypothetical protein